MRIFNKMKKMLLVAAALFAVNGAFAESKTVNYIQNDKDNVPGAETVNVSLDAISFSYLGDAGGWDVKSNKQSYSGNSYTHYASGKSNPTVTDGVPTAGSVMGFVPKYDGQIALCMVVNAGKATFVLEDGEGLSSFDVDGKWNDGSVADTTIASGGKLNQKCYGTITFPVKANKQYYVYCTGSKMGYYGFSYTYDDAPAVEVPAADSLKIGEVTILEAGKTYVFGKQYEMYKVQFTAETDGFLSITPSQKVNSTSLKINGASSTFTKVNGGIEKKGMAVGSVFEGTFYCSGTPSADNVYELVVTFEEGAPYSPLALTLANPADGAEWSGAVEYKSYGTKGVPHYEFSSIISADVKASVKIGDKVYENIKLTVDGYYPKLDITALPDTLSKAIAAGLIKAGETFTLTLSNIVDKEFAANTLADQTFTYTLASTACTGVSPAVSTSRTTMVTDVTFSFDGTVALADTAKFYMVNLANNEVTELTGEVVEGTSVKVTVPAIEGLLPRLYNIVATGVTTAEGDKVITYGTEPGKLVASYGTSNGFFKAVTSLQNWGQVCSLKGFTATYPGEVIAVEGIATKPITVVKVSEMGEEEEMPGVTLGYTINGNVIEFALSKTITELGTYRMSVPQKHFWAKDTYTEEDAKLSTPMFAYYQAGITLTIDVVEPTATDVTDKLVNPNFDDATYSTGWTDGTAQLKGFGTSSNAMALKDGKIFVGNIVEKWESGNWTGDLAQTVKELPAGAYKFTMGAYANNAGEAYVFANDSLSLPLAAAKVGEYTTFVELTEGADLKVGVKNVSGINWIVMDNAHLYYYGDGSTVDMAIKADWKVLLAAVAELKAAYAAPIEVEALDAAVAAAKMGTAQEYQASVKAVNEAMAAFKKVNDAEVAWKTLAAALKDATADAPVDATGFIANPSFEAGVTKVGDGTGGGAINCPNEWRVTYSQEGWGDFAKNGTNPQDGSNNFNIWSATLHNVNLYQEVRLPAGSYSVSAALRTEKAEQVTDQHVYVKIGEDVDSSAVLGAPIGDSWNALNAWQTLSVAFSLEKETVVTIGAGSTGGANSAGWFQIDNFRLSCTGWVDPALISAVDSLNALVAETEAYQKTLDLTDAMQASMNSSLVQEITAAKAAAEAKESVTAVRGAYNQLNMMYVQIVANIAGMEAQAAQTMMGEYENPTDEAGLANAITKVQEIVSNMMSNPENTYTVADLNAAVEAMRTAQEAFVKENTKITEVSVSLTHTASSYSGATAGDFTSTVDAEKEHINNSKFSGTWAGAAYAEFSVLIPEGVSVKSATLAWSGVGSNKNRTTDIMYVGAGATIDYAAMQSTGKESVDLSATKIETVTFTANATTDFTTDVTDAVKTIVEGGQNYIIFKFTNNVGGGDLVGKGAAEKAPVLTLETVDASAMTTYTVKYVDGEGNEVKAAGVYDIVTGETATVSDEDKAAIYTEDNAKKYIYVSSDKESIVTVADSASNVITATFREAATYNYTVEAVDDSGILAHTLGSYSNFEGESVKVPYNAYVLVEGTFYQAAATNKEYNKYVDLTQDNMKVQVVYTPTTIENVVYYQEAEDVEGLTKITTGNTAIRSSNSASAYAADADVVLTTLAPGKYKLAAVIYDATKNYNSEFSFIAGSDTILKAVSTAANWTNCASEEFTLTANTAISLAKGGSSSKGVDFVYIQKTGDVAARFDLTAYNDTVAWANEMKATLDATNESEAEVIMAIDDFIASAAQWLEEVEADPEATQADVDFIAQDLKAQISAVMSRVQLSKLWPEAEALRAEADSVYASYTDPTDEAGLVDALRSFPRSPMFVTSVEELQAAMETLKAAMEAFIAENSVVGGPVALTVDMFKEWDKVEADAQVIGDATSEMGIGQELGAGAMVYGASTVDPLRYADLTAYDKIVIEGTPGVQLRVLMNRALGGEAPNFNGALVEVNVTIGEDGKAEVDLTAYDYAHLNAIKTGWGSAAGTITSITLETIEAVKIAYLQTKGDKNDAIYDALVAGGYAVDTLAYADVTLSDEIIESELVGYDVVVLGGSTGSSANLAKTANLLLGKVNVLSTKAFWYKHYGANGDNPGTADAPSLSIAKVAGYEEHPIYAGIEGDEFAVFNDMGKSTGRYLQSNGSFANGPEQAALGTANGANSIGEAWVDGFGYIIIPVDGLQPSGYLTADGAQLFVNAVEYLIAGEEFEFNAIEGVQVEGAQWPADIYDLSGRMIKKAATSLEGLEKGLYIVNGKKLLVK